MLSLKLLQILVAYYTSIVPYTTEYNVFFNPEMYDRIVQSHPELKPYIDARIKELMHS